MILYLYRCGWFDQVYTNLSVLLMMRSDDRHNMTTYPLWYAPDKAHGITGENNVLPVRALNPGDRGLQWCLVGIQSSIVSHLEVRNWDKFKWCNHNFRWLDIIRSLSISSPNRSISTQKFVTLNVSRNPSGSLWYNMATRASVDRSIFGNTHFVS